MEKAFEGLEAFARFLEKNGAAHEIAMIETAKISGVVLLEKIRHVMGDNQKLQDLAPSTQAERVRLGYTPNDPLVRSGELQKSFEAGHDGHLTGGAGTPNKVMVYQEFGTATIPPRPAIEIGIKEARPEIEVLAGEAVAIGLGFGRGLRKILPI